MTIKSFPKTRTRRLPERLESALRNFVGFAAVLADLDDLLGNDLRLTCASLIFRQIERATGRFLLQQMVAVAELEAGMISTRTKAALAATKRRGVKLGGNRGVKPSAKPLWEARKLR
jgi:DNA invertase Pin-like site-specific DNA recombinase